MKSIHLLSGAAIWLLVSGMLHGQALDPTFAPPPLEPVPEQASPYDVPPLSSGDEMLAEVESDCEPVRLSARFALGITLADFSVTDGSTSWWTTEPSTVARFEYGLETPDGVGLRVQSWSLENEWETDQDPLEIRLATFYIDGYRRFTSENGELLLGGGMAIGSLKIDSQYDDTVRRFNGLGGSLVGEGFLPLLRFDKTEIGAVGRARLAMLGPLQDNFDDSQPMLVDELGVGLELRRRFGKHEEKMWFVRVAREYQHWSDLDAPFAVDQRIEATSFTVGVAW